MTATRSGKELLTLCMWDLRECARRMAARLEQRASAAHDGELRDLLAGVREGAAQRTRSLAPIAGANGPENLWIAGVLDDCERDTRSIEQGPLLDTALIGAVRKALAAEAVSIETGLALARAAQSDPHRQMLADNLAHVRSDDDRLARVLREIAMRAARIG